MRRALALLNAAADGAADDEVTPAAIADEVRAASAALAGPPSTQAAGRHLADALDAISDGMPADYVARILYAALAALDEGA